MKHRDAFTLMELMVVVGITLLLGTLGLAIVAGTSTDQKVRNATELLQAKILIARMRAISEAAPYGVRLVQGSDGLVHQFLFIEQAPPIPAPGSPSEGNVMVPSSDSPPGSGNYTLTFDTLDMTGGFNNTPDMWRVQPGDSIRLVSSSTTYPIVQINSTNPGGGGTLTIYSATSPAGILNYSGSNFQIYRANRPLAGEDPISLSDGVCVDLANTVPTASGGKRSMSVIYAERYEFTPAAMQALASQLSPADYQQIQPLAGASYTVDVLTYVVLTQLGLSNNDLTIIENCTPVYDIMFDSTGRILSTSSIGSGNNISNQPLGRVILWVRDATTPSPYYTGVARLLVIYTQTGLIAVHDVDRSQTYFQPFSFSQDGLPSGL